MNKGKELILGIDTSNYTTSMAITDLDGNILIDERILLKVKQGERGLRQSHALFQHVENLPIVTERVFSKLRDTYFYNQDMLSAVSVSGKPRPQNDSYMPCFLSGISLGKSIASSLNIPYFETSHQEGHIAAAVNEHRNLPDKFLAYHISGGTCELLKVEKEIGKYNISIIGGSKDISYGQVIDRIGVALGFEFPSGKEMDNIAEKSNIATAVLKKIPIQDSYINLSGIETQAQRYIEGIDRQEIPALITEVFNKIADSLFETCLNASKAHDLKHVVLVGGVSASRYIRRKILSLSEEKEIFFSFGKAEFSSDNAVGVSLLGGENFGHKTN